MGKNTAFSKRDCTLVDLGIPGGPGINPLGHLGYLVVHFCFCLIYSGYNLFCSYLGKETLSVNNAKMNKTRFLF